jgi:transaldolase
VANARLAYHAFQEVFSTPRWASLEAEGAHRQRPLWASTGVKDPAYKDTMYVEELAAPNTVNTMPTKTMLAVADHGEITGDRVSAAYDESRNLLDALERLGISYVDVVAVLEREGVEKFATSWSELLSTVQTELTKASQ